MNKTNKILAGIFLVAAVVSASLYFKKASKYDEYRAQINNVVKDPGSTVFKNEKISPNGVYCAEVNSKNSYGAFVGFERVMAKTDGNEWGSGGSYVFFEREGLEGSGGYQSIILLKIEIVTVREHNSAREKELAGGDNATQSENEYRETALRKVFEKQWSENCSLKISEVAPVVVTQEVKPHPPMPNNGGPDQYADQGAVSRASFRLKTYVIGSQKIM